MIENLQMISHAMTEHLDHFHKRGRDVAIDNGDALTESLPWKGVGLVG